MTPSAKPLENDLGTTRSGMEPTAAGALCYLLGFISGLLFYIVEKDNTFVRFHALQSILTFGAWFVAIMVFRVIPILGFIVNFFLMIAGFILWLFLMLKAGQGIAFKLPFVGDLIERHF